MNYLKFVLKYIWFAIYIGQFGICLTVEMLSNASFQGKILGIVFISILPAVAGYEIAGVMKGDKDE